MDKYLIYINKPNNSTIFKECYANAILSIGRSHHNDIVINDDFLETEHLRISFNEESFILQDLNTKNGFYIKGKKVLKKECKSNEKIIIVVGRTIIEIVGKDYQKDKAPARLLPTNLIQNIIPIPLFFTAFLTTLLLCFFNFIDTIPEYTITGNIFMIFLFSIIFIKIDNRLTNKKQNFLSYVIIFEFLFIILHSIEWILKVISFIASDNIYAYLLIPIISTGVIFTWTIKFKNIYGYKVGLEKDFAHGLAFFTWIVAVLGFIGTNYTFGALEGKQVGSYQIYPKLTKYQKKLTIDEYINNVEKNAELVNLTEKEREKINQKID